MCGICGEISFSGPPSTKRIHSMLEKINHRGPDSSGTHTQGVAIFGHSRLAVIDLTNNAHQPLVDSHDMLVFNGCIYNYQSLRRRLIEQGYVFKSTSDSEVILRAYQAWGEACVEKLEGMFAFALWDEKKQQLLLARDRLGIKPLYFSKSATAFRFASTLQALLEDPNVDTSIDNVALHHQFMLHAVVPAPRSLFKGIQKVSPGTHMTITASGKITKKRYWSLTAERPKEIFSQKEWIAQTRMALKNSIRTHFLAADVPIGVLLSGGLDSSLIVALMNEIKQESQINTPIHTFSIGFESVAEESGDEFLHSNQVAKQQNTLHTNYFLTNKEVLTRLPEAIAHLSEPLFSQDSVAFYLLSEQVSKEVKVVMSGQGADETFGGYFWYEQMEKAAQAFPQNSALENFAPFYFDRTHQEWLKMIAPAFHCKDETSALVDSLLNQPGATEHLDKVFRLDVTTLLIEDPVKRVDNMTMAWGLETRVPFLDHRLVELAMRMPPNLKMKGGGKYPLKEIARGLIPDSIIDRPKAYFPMPALKYVRGEFLDFMHDILMSQACINRGIYQRSYVDQLLKDPENHYTKIQGNKLWHLALFEYWFQLNVDRSF